MNSTNAGAASYAIRPFGGPRYRENAENCRDTTPCGICGKGIQDVSKARMAVVVKGGTAWGDENSDPNDGGFMGYWPIGPDCHRKYAVELPRTEREVNDLIAETLRLAYLAEYDARTEAPEASAKRRHRDRARRLREKAVKIAAAWRVNGR